MSFDFTPVYLDWEKLLDKHVVIVKSALTTNDFGAVDGFIVDEKTSRIDHTATFKRFIESDNLDPNLTDTTDKLEGLNEQAVEDGRSAYDDFSSTVAGLKDTPPDGTQWRIDIDNAATKAKEAAKKTIDDAAADAKAVINGLPESARAPAANVFTSGLNAVANFFSHVWSQIKVIAESLYQFLVGIWDKIKVALDTVQSAATTAINWIQGEGADGPRATDESLFRQG